NMFQTIARQGGGRVPEFLSSHPDPGNRFQTINREAQLLEVSSNPIKVTRDFQLVQSRLNRMPPARSMSEIQQQGGAGTGGGGTSQMGGGRYSNNVPAPSRRYRSYRSGNWITMSVPDNWREFAEQTSVTFAPDGAFGNQGNSAGAMLGLFRSSSNTLTPKSQESVKGLIQGNPHLRHQSWFQHSRFAGRQAMVTQLAGQSPINGRTEVV